jgi:hypothetical protein
MAIDNGGHKAWGDFVFEQLERLIYRYCLKELGQAA